MKIAICFSGYPQPFSLVKDNLKIHFDNWFNQYDVFGYFPEPSPDISLTFPDSQISIIPDSPLDISQIPSTNRFKTGPQAYIQQIYGWYKSNQLRKQWEISQGFTYDWVIRCRPDIKFVSGDINLSLLSSDHLHIPNFHHWGGYNDRFCIGSSSLIDNYMDIFEDYLNEPSKCLHAESFLKYCLDKKNTTVNLIDLKFNRVRSSGEEIIDD